MPRSTPTENFQKNVPVYRTRNAVAYFAATKSRHRDRNYAMPSLTPATPPRRIWSTERRRGSNNKDPRWMRKTDTFIAPRHGTIGSESVLRRLFPSRESLSIINATAESRNGSENASVECDGLVRGDLHFAANRPVKQVDPRAVVMRANSSCGSLDLTDSTELSLCR